VKIDGEKVKLFSKLKKKIEVFPQIAKINVDILITDK
jgi:hypothetical protein